MDEAEAYTMPRPPIAGGRVAAALVITSSLLPLGGTALKNARFE